MSQPPAGRDLLVRALAAGGALRALACVTTGVVEEARRRHGLSPTAAAALGRLMTAAALMAASLKGRERILLQLIGEGPLGHAVAEADASGHIRGYVAHPRVHLPPNSSGKLDVAGAVGRGQLVVIRDLGLREPYRASVGLVSGEVAQDVAYYLARSEQTPSAVALGVLVAAPGFVQAAGGWMVLPMPEAPAELIGELERRANQAQPPTSAVSRLAPEEAALAMLQELLAPWDLAVLGQQPLRFACPCSRSRFEEGLSALGRQELLELAEKQPELELVCRFCARKYRFPAARLRQLAETAGEPRVHPMSAGGWPTP